MKNINIVLHCPEIPQNTGNIARTCAATGAALHIIKPMGFEIDDKKLKRAGLDYWHLLDITYYENEDEFFSLHKDANIYYFSTKAPASYTDVSYSTPVFLMFGRETAGLPRELVDKNPETSVRIPMLSDRRCLNLSNSVAIVLYEALRQNGFGEMQLQGELHRLQW